MDDRETRIEQLTHMFADRIREFLEPTVGEFIQNDEKLLEIAGELASLGYSGDITLQPNMVFSLHGEGESVAPDTSQDETAGKQESSLVNLHFGESTFDKNFGALFGLGEADFKEMEEMRREGRNTSTNLETDSFPPQPTKQSVAKNAGAVQDGRTVAQISSSIVRIANDMRKIIQRHNVAYSINHINVLTSLGGNFPEDSRIVQILLDDKAWMRKILELIAAIVNSKTSNDNKKAALLYVEDVLNYYSKW